MKAKDSLIVAGVRHRRLKRRDPETGRWWGTCSCGELDPKLDSPGENAARWRKHVASAADAAGAVAVREIDSGPVTVPVVCEDCGFRLSRQIPSPVYHGPVGPCPRCHGRTRRLTMAEESP